MIELENQAPRHFIIKIPESVILLFAPQPHGGLFYCLLFEPFQGLERIEKK